MEGMAEGVLYPGKGFHKREKAKIGGANETNSQECSEGGEAREWKNGTEAWGAQARTKENVGRTLDEAIAGGRHHSVESYQPPSVDFRKILDGMRKTPGEPHEAPACFYFLQL
jgi:hypothetical protein